MSERVTDADFVPVTTWSRRKRHWALAAGMEPYRHGGRRGLGLCPQSGGATDQESTDAETAKYSTPGRTLVIAVADLSPCKICDKVKAARILGGTQ